MNVIERRDIEAPFRREPAEQIVAIPGGVNRAREQGNEQLPFAGGDDVGKHRERFRIHEGHGAANHHERMPRIPVRGARRQTREAQERHDIRVVPLERHGKREHVEVRDGGLRFERQQRDGRLQLRLQFLLRGQEHPLAHDVVQIVEEAVDGLEAEARHADVVRVWKGQRDAEAAAVRLAHVADLAREHVARTFAMFPVLH